MTFEQLLEGYKKQKSILKKKEAVIEERNAVLEEKEVVLEEKEAAINKMQTQISQMQFQIDQMNRLLYGAKRERFISSADENQLTLPFDVEQEEAPEKDLACIIHK